METKQQRRYRLVYEMGYKDGRTAAFNQLEGKQIICKGKECPLYPNSKPLAAEKGGGE